MTTNVMTSVGEPPGRTVLRVWQDYLVSRGRSVTRRLVNDVL